MEVENSINGLYITIIAIVAYTMPRGPLSLSKELVEAFNL